MLIEKILFSVCALTLFILMTLYAIKKKDKNYAVILGIQLVGIIIRLICIVFGININRVVQVICYMCSILLPISVFICIMKKINVSEIIALMKYQTYMLLKNTKKAKNVMLDFASKYPNSAIAHKLLADLYEKEGGMRKAIDEYVQAMDINKRDYNSYYRIAYLLTNLDKKEESIQMLTTLLSKKNDHLEAAVLLGDLLIEKEQYKEATNIYLEALKYNPQSYELNYNLAMAYTMLNDFQSAKEYYEIASQINTLCYNSKYSLAEIALIYKELNEAEEHFLEIIQDGQMLPDSYYELAKISLIKGDKDRAITYANMAIEEDAKRIAPKIKNDVIFIPILSKIAIPFNLENEPENENIQISEKEMKVREHLEEMVDITKNLSYSDINLLKREETQENVIQNEFELSNEFYKER